MIRLFIVALMTLAMYASAETLTYSNRDDGGTAEGGIDIQVTPNTITITITEVNDPPMGADITLPPIPEGGTYIFKVADFGFSDPADSPPNNFQDTRINSLPATGTVTLNGVPVSVDDWILVTDIEAGLLVYTAAP